MEPESYKSIVPFPGDFHAAVHMLMAMHALWWVPLICWVVNQTDLSVQSISEEWSSVELYNRYRFLYEVAIVGILTYICETVPDELLSQPALLLEVAADRNQGLEVLLYFLFDFGFPWLGFRQATRKGDSSAMDSMYALVLPWFRVTGKHQYARICIDYIWAILALNPALSVIWAKYRTCSLLGNPGRDISWDQANEFMNLEVKSMDPKDPARIDVVIRILNGLKSTDEHLRSALGTERTDTSEYTPVKASHVLTVVGALKEGLGRDSNELFGDNRKKTSPFGSGPRPWIKVRNPGDSRLAPLIRSSMKKGPAG